MMLFTMRLCESVWKSNGCVSPDSNYPSGYCTGLCRHATSWTEVAKKSQTHKEGTNICKCYLLNILVKVFGRICESYEMESLF
ncbi:hypothetical protein CLF_109345 [Clonorchis sinensis]|uniref:Uncharacterized protein n=1 Tax=Clonorchis sinensis TaxID=79923 RepID=G7YJ87_CLOSI|nr:hypothetical protein CLF_109345 [Clonorchis sinensis]